MVRCEKSEENTNRQIKESAKYIICTIFEVYLPDHFMKI